MFYVNKYAEDLPRDEGGLPSSTSLRVGSSALKNNSKVKNLACAVIFVVCLGVMT